MNYPLECWDVNVISRIGVPYGRFLIWNKDPRDKTRIIVKVRVINPDTLPLSIVVLRNLDDIGYGTHGHVQHTFCPEKSLGSREGMKMMMTSANWPAGLSW